jgi:hypothetical protein
MPRPKSKIDELSENERKDLIKRLWEWQGGICFLCEEKINLEVDKVEIDHIIPLADKGPDEEGNWALMHAEPCHSKKGTDNLHLAKAKMKFEKIKERYGGAVTTAQILEEFGGSKEEVFAKIENNEIVLRFGNKDYTYRIFTDPSNDSYKCFFALLPIEILYHDSELNPRKIVEIDKLIEEFFRRNPQLHVTLCRMHFPESGGRSKILLFDGQHKAAAQVILGRKEVFCRVFINPDHEHLKEVNRRAHKELRQIEFFRSVLDTLGQDIFSINFKEYLENPNTTPKSEKGFINWIEAEKRNEMEKNLAHYLKARIRDFKTPENKFFKFVEMEKARSRKLPISYDSVEKTFFRWFVDSTPCEVNIYECENQGKAYPRDIEAKNVVRLMNMFAEKTLENKFDEKRGAYKIEEQVRKHQDIPDEHLRAFRLYRPAIFITWCELLKEAIAVYLTLNRKIDNDMKGERKKGKGTRIFWVELDEKDWAAINEMVEKLISHKIWIDRGEKISNVFGQTRPEFFKKFFQDQSIDVSYLLSAVGGKR